METLHGRWPMDYRNAYLAHEYCLQTYTIDKMDLPDLDGSDDARTAVKLSLKRKLAASTRGLLEVQDSRESCIVSFAHRTAYEWTTEAKTQKIIVEQCRPRFDPCLFLLEIFVFHLLKVSFVRKLYWPNRDNNISNRRAWTLNVMRSLWCASKVGDQHPENVDALVRALDCLNHHLEEQCQKHSSVPPDADPGMISSHFKRCSWANAWEWLDWVDSGPNFHVSTRHRTFLAMTAQFGIVPYLKAKSNSDHRILYQGGAEGVAGILESCIFFFDTGVSIGRELPLRLQTIEFLRSMGVEQVKFHKRRVGRDSWESHRVREQVALKAQMAQENGDMGLHDYYKEVAQILGPDGLRPALRLGLMRLRLMGYKGVGG
jgi:hypothetical protein